MPRRFGTILQQNRTPPRTASMVEYNDIYSDIAYGTL